LCKKNDELEESQPLLTQRVPIFIGNVSHKMWVARFTNYKEKIQHNEQGFVFVAGGFIRFAGTEARL
jgi:hypothetical protein